MFDWLLKLFKSERKPTVSWFFNGHGCVVNNPDTTVPSIGDIVIIHLPIGSVWRVDSIKHTMHYQRGSLGSVHSLYISSTEIVLNPVKD